MHQQTITDIVNEVRATSTGLACSRLFQLSAASFAFDFRLGDGRFLFISSDPSLPRVYLIARRLRDLDKQSIPLSPFGQALRSSLTDAKLVLIEKDEADRVVRFHFEREDEIGELNRSVLVAQLTGRSANLFLLNATNTISHSLRLLKGVGQQIGGAYSPPSARSDNSEGEPPFDTNSFASISAAADDYYSTFELRHAFDARASAVKAKLNQERSRMSKLERHLKADLVAHGNAEEHKRMGDLLLANIATAQRDKGIVRLTDYYADGAPTIEVELDQHSTLQEEAARCFAKYTKAKRAATQIAARLEETATALIAIERKQTALERIIDARDEDELAAFVEERAQPKGKPRDPRKRDSQQKIPGTRSYLSSDGYEIIVGRAAKDNDHLTFRVARPNDLWLHAADYPGSHVIVRVINRKEIPQRTVIEAAQLAGKFSQASEDPKVDVHYTPRKFVSKIKGAAPGLVRLSTFKTITVEPSERLSRIRSRVIELLVK